MDAITNERKHFAIKFVDICGRAIVSNEKVLLAMQFKKVLKVAVISSGHKLQLLSMTSLR